MLAEYWRLFNELPVRVYFVSFDEWHKPGPFQLERADADDTGTIRSF